MKRQFLKIVALLALVTISLSSCFVHRDGMRDHHDHPDEHHYNDVHRY